MISIIVCTYNRCDSLGAALTSIVHACEFVSEAVEIIVVDNNSVDATEAVISAVSGSARIPVRYIKEAKQGLSFARNAGIAHARGDIVVFTDDDVTVDPDWLAAIERGFNQYHCVAMGGRIIPVWSATQPRWYSDSGPMRSPNAIIRLDLGANVRPANTELIGANMAFQRHLFERYGMFRTDLGRTNDGLTGSEDIEFFKRLKDGQELSLYIPGAIVFHPVSPERARKRYFQSWCYHIGRSQVRVEGIPPNAVRYWGIPRYLLRMIAANLVRWHLSFGCKRRCYYKFQVYWNLGLITESCAVNRNTQMATAGANAGIITRQ